MSTKQEALKVVVAAIATAGEKVLRTDKNPAWLWWRDSTPEALNHVKKQLEGEQGGSEAASLIGCALRVFETGQCSEKSWKIVRLELDDAKKKLEAAIEIELVKEVVDSVAHITGEKRVRAEGLTLAGVLFAVAGDSKLAEAQRELAEAKETGGKLVRLCSEAKDELAKVRKELEALKSQKPDPGSLAEAWSMICGALYDRLPAWNDNKGLNAAQNAAAAIRQVVDEAMLNRAKASAWDRVRQVLQETDDKWNDGPHDEPSNAESAIRVMAQKVVDSASDAEFRQAVIREINLKVPLWMSGQEVVGVAAVNAIRHLAGKKGELAAVKEERDSLRKRLDAVKGFLR